MGDITNEVFEPEKFGLSGVSSWTKYKMIYRKFPPGNVYNDPTIDFFVMPLYIADEYYFKIDNFENTLIDYYIEAIDNNGNKKLSDIYHVWIGNNDPQ